MKFGNGTYFVKSQYGYTTILNNNNKKSLLLEVDCCVLVFYKVIGE